MVHPLPGIWDTLTINTAITLPVGVEAYAVYALAVATDPRPVTTFARRWAWASAAGALLLGMAGQIAYHLLDAHSVRVAPWWVVALVSSLPVLVLGAASLLWHLAARPSAPPAPPGEWRRDGGADEYAAPEVPDMGTAVPASAAVAAPSTAAAVPATASPSVSGAVTGDGLARAAVPAADTHALDQLPVLDDASAAGSTHETEPGVRRLAAADHRATQPPRITASVTSPADDDILAAITVGPRTDVPSIRALMRTYGIGQSRATRIHRAANNHQNRRRPKNENENEKKHENDDQETRPETQEAR